MSMSRLITGSCVVNWEKLQKSPPLQMCPRASNILWILANYLTWRDYSHFPQLLAAAPVVLSVIIPTALRASLDADFWMSPNENVSQLLLLPQRGTAVSAENSVNNLLQFLASVGVSAGLCCSLIELAPDPRKIKLIKSPHAIPWRCDRNFNSISIYKCRWLSSIDILFSALSHFSKPYSNIACLEDILASYRNKS